MLKKINYIFSLENIFDFSHSWFDTVRVKSNRNGMKGKEFRAGTCDVRA